MTATQKLIATLQEQCEVEDSWLIRQDGLEEFYDPVDLYRALFQADQLATEIYEPANAGELVQAVGLVTGRDYRDEFRSAGLYLTYEDRIELTGRFVRTVKNAVVLHTPDPEMFRAMLRSFRQYDEARLTYFQTYFPVNELAAKCAQEYQDVRFASISETARPALQVTVQSYLKLLVQRHVVEFASLAPALMEILRTVALQEGFLHAGRRAEASADSDAVYEDEATTGRDAARRLLGLNVSQPTKKELQAAYRSLMRKYHPDVNPDGLEMAKKINRAYGLLLSSVESG